MNSWLSVFLFVSAGEDLFSTIQFFVRTEWTLT